MFWLESRRLPLIVAHRGASRRAPENTLAAFSRAIEDGADAVELDVRLTADGAVVVIHDARLDRTTDGRGEIRLLSYARVREVSAGALFHPVFAREGIPTLDEVLELTGRRVGVNIEMKADFRHRASATLPDAVLRIVRRHRAEPSVLLSSFHHALLRRARLIRPEVVRGYLVHTLRSFARSPLRRARREGGAYIIVNGTSCTAGLVRRAHAAGLRVGEYTVNTARRIRRARRLGVDAVITDDPSRTLEGLAGGK